MAVRFSADRNDYSSEAHQERGPKQHYSLKLFKDSTQSQKERALMRWNVLAVVVTLALIAIAVYFSLDKPFRFEQSSESQNQLDTPTAPVAEGPRSEPAGAAAISPTPRYGNEIKKCTATDGSTFYTNAINCGAADLSKRVSVIDAPDYSKPANAPRATASQPKTAQQTANRRPVNRCDTLNLRSNVSPSKDVPRSCKWEWGRALELERLMSGADKPSSSMWVGEYCKRLTEIRQNGCNVVASEFCYEQVCLGR